MELIFLDRNTLAYKDYGYVDNNFEINLDLVLIKKSTFVVNKTNINTNVGDIVVLKELKYFYIGIVETIEISSNNQTTINSLDFKEIFNFEVPVTSYIGDIADFIENLISIHLLNSTDTKQNLSYLTISKETSINAALTFEVDKLMTIQDILELVSKSYGINIKCEVMFLRDRITGINIRIIEVTKGIKLKSNLSSLSDLVISDNETQMINKVIFYPKQENKTCKNIITFYLLINGEVTQENINEARYKTVNLKSLYYSNSDFLTLDTKARSGMLSSKLDHNITFNLLTDNYNFRPLDNLNIGDFIEFILPNKTYDSVVTAIKFKDSLKLCSVTLGEYRIKLTEKIQLLNKNVTSAVGNVSVQTNTKEIDGGEY